MNKYSEQYKDPRWQKLRLKIFERDNWTCQNCSNNKITLHVHHRYYLKDKEIWEYQEEAFITLCVECHLNEIENRDNYEKTLLEGLKRNFLCEDILELAGGFYQMPLLHGSDVIASVYRWALSDKNIQRELIEKYFKYLKKKKNN